MKSDASFFTEGFRTNIECGGVDVGTTINSGDKVTDVVKKMLKSNKPSTKYESKNLGSWTSPNDVNNFFAAHNVENSFEFINIGNYVTIQDGVYNTQWVVAGFTCEHNATASDGTVYDNGVGMLMIPKTELTRYNWHSVYGYVATPYINSDIHSFINSTVYNNLKNILGNHIVQRNVLLGSEQNGNGQGYGGGTSAYTWTTSYLTLMSIGQMNGTFASNNNKYDDGEANYKLPLFDHEEVKTDSNFWSRCAWGFNKLNGFCVWYVNSAGGIDNINVNDATGIGVRPLMLLR